MPPPRPCFSWQRQRSCQRFAQLTWRPSSRPSALFRLTAAPLFVLLLLLLCAPQLAGAVTATRIRRCLPKGSDTALGVSSAVRCPCLVQFHADAKQRPSSGTSIDFLVVRAAEADRIRKLGPRADFGDIKYEDAYTTMGLVPNIFDLKNSEYVASSPARTIDEDADFALMVRSTSSEENCDIQPEFVLEPVPATCHTKLFPPSGQSPASRWLRSSSVGGVADFARNRVGSAPVGSSFDLPRVPTRAYQPIFDKVDAPHLHQAIVNEERVRSERSHVHLVERQRQKRPLRPTRPSHYQSSEPLQVLASSRIVGGFKPPDETVKSLAAITRGGTVICAGGVLSSRWILTAAHCAVRTSDRVLVGGATPGEGSPFFIERVISHPDHDRDVKGSPWDIAVVELKSPISDPSILRVPSRNVDGKDGVLSSGVEAGALVRVSGYGSYSENWPTLFDNEARSVDVPAISMEDCEKQLGSRSKSLARLLEGNVQMCAGFTDGGCDSCFGDSGGPLTAYDEDGHLVQVGLVSFGVGCARPETPGVYTSIAPFHEWLKSTEVDFTSSSAPLSVVRAESMFSGVNATKGASWLGWGKNSDSGGGADGDGEGGLSARMSLIIGLCVGAAGVVLALSIGVCLYCCIRDRRRKNEGDLGTSGGLKSGKLRCCVCNSGDSADAGEEGGETEPSSTTVSLENWTTASRVPPSSAAAAVADMSLAMTNEETSESGIHPGHVVVDGSETSSDVVRNSRGRAQPLLSSQPPPSPQTGRGGRFAFHRMSVPTSETDLSAASASEHVGSRDVIAQEINGADVV